MGGNDVFFLGLFFHSTWEGRLPRRKEPMGQIRPGSFSMFFNDAHDACLL